MIFKKIAPKIYAVETETSKEAGQIFIRLQENYESKKYRNKVFTYTEFVKWYKEDRKSEEFTYYDDWAGFNVPGHIAVRFMKGKFNPLRLEEKWLLEEIENAKIKGKFYLIGYASKDARVKKHEIAHGLYYTNNAYRRKVKEILKDIDMVNHPVAQHLREQGYHQSVVPDEFHAWCLTDSFWLDKAGLWNKTLDTIKMKLYDLYEEYANET